MNAIQVADVLRREGWTVNRIDEFLVHAAVYGELADWHRHVAVMRVDGEWWLYCGFRSISGQHERPITERPVGVETAEDIEMLLATCGPKSHAHRVGAA